MREYFFAGLLDNGEILNTFLCGIDNFSFFFLLSFSWLEIKLHEIWQKWCQNTDLQALHGWYFGNIDNVGRKRKRLWFWVACSSAFWPIAFLLGIYIRLCVYIIFQFHGFFFSWLAMPWNFLCRFTKQCAWFIVVIQSLLIVASHKHYTVDVVVAW